MAEPSPRSAEVGARDPTAEARARPFPLDRFQVEAIDALDRGESVLVAAPTGSGKTVVAEHAVDLAIAAGAKCFYTAPIKALSNQKYHDLVALHGPERVGLLTGDTVRNPEAPVAVMTTEVLRNMLYRASPALAGLRYVVLDEVHFLQDEYRGPVWEEVMIHLPDSVRLVCLSATVSNADELGSWISTVRGPTAVVVEERRPVRLTNHFVVEDRTRDELVVLPTLVGGKPNAEGERYDRADSTRLRGRPRRPFATPRRLDVVDLLQSRDLLPAIWFIFSRAACDDAVTATAGAVLRLTTPEERARITELAEAHVGALGDDDLRVLGYDRWLSALTSGVAAHHAGMVPPFKEAVEACFVEGLVKVVFATETLALGINMPARSVVIEKLTKFTGERHEFLTPAQYTQLTGRAGRRGIDDAGHALVLWSPFVPFSAVANLAASKRFVLTSAFRPTYNMAANLVLRYDPERAHRLLNLSFAQFQADQAVVRLELDLTDRRRHLATAEERLLELAGPDQADELLAVASAADAVIEPVEAPSPNRAVLDALNKLRPGDVLRMPRPRPEIPTRPAVVLSVAQRGSGPKLRVVSAARKVRTVGAADFAEPPKRLGRLHLPTPYRPESDRYQRDVAEALARSAFGQSDGERDGDGDGDGDGGAGRGGAGRGSAARRAQRQAAAESAELARAVRRVVRLRRTVASLEGQIQRRTESLARRFDQLLQLLDAWGYLDGWALTSRGERLAGIYHECDLLVAEAVEEGLFDDLDPASLAGLVSCLTYEHRSPVPPAEPWFPTPKVAHRVGQLAQLAIDLADAERAAGLPQTRQPDPTFFALAHAWVAGEDLDRVLEDEDLSPGDFVRNVKQLMDLLRQVGETAGEPATRRAARAATAASLRGVVLASTLVGGE
jgi:ATP-dependent RNA helicase HelY